MAADALVEHVSFRRGFLAAALSPIGTLFRDEARDGALIQHVCRSALTHTHTHRLQIKLGRISES